MATIVNERPQWKLSWRGLATPAAVALFLGSVLFFLSNDVPDVPGKPASMRWAYWLHIIGGTLVMATGPFQFIAPIRNRFRRYHRIAGYTFLAGTAMAFTGFLFVSHDKPDFFFASQATAISLWVIAAFAAWRAARRKRFLTHRHNMTRAFVLASYFVIVRLMNRFGMPSMAFLTSSTDAQFAHSDWLSWVIPLVLVEAYYGRQWDALLKKRERPARAD